MHQRTVVYALALPFLSLTLPAGCGGSRTGPAAVEPPGTAPAESTSATASPPAAPSASTALPGEPPGLAAPSEETSAHARRGLAMGSPEQRVDPSVSTIPSPPPTIETSPHAGVDAAIKAVPSNVPIGRLSKDSLEAPLRDRTKFERCRIPRGTKVDIAAVVYNGAALGVDVKTQPNDRSVNFCIERVVRQTTWVKELAVNKVNVSF